MQAFQRETALYGLNALSIPAGADCYDALCRMILHAAETPCQSAEALAAAADPEDAGSRLLRSMQHIILEAWENGSLAHRMRADEFIAYAAQWLRDAENNNQNGNGAES